MIPIAPSERCRCRRPQASGRRYYGREACTGCNGFIVVSANELAALRRLEEAELERERELAAPKTERPVEDIGDDFERMYPALAQRLRPGGRGTPV